MEQTEQRYRDIMAFFRDHKVVEIEFIKKDGTLRSMLCTLDPTFMPERDQNEHHKTKLVDYTTVTVWDFESEGFRAFKTDNLISIKEAE